MLTAAIIAKGIAGATGAAGFTASTVARSAGFYAVKHYGGKLILKKGAHYVAGTIGMRALGVAAGPAVSAGLLVATFAPTAVKFFLR